MNFRTIFSIVCVSMFCTAAMAQVKFTITSGSLSRVVKIGETVAIDTVTTLPATFTVGDSGSKTATYDFSALTFTQGSTETYVDPASTPDSMFSNPGAGATVAFADTYPVLGSGYSYYKLDLGGLSKVGFSNPSGSVRFISYYLENLPLKVDSSWVTSGNMITQVSGVPLPNTLQIKQVYACDALGTLTTSRGSWPCLRVRTTIFLMRTTVVFDSVAGHNKGVTDTTKNIIVSYFTGNGENVEVTLKDTADAKKPSVVPSKIMYRHINGAPTGVAENVFAPTGLSLMSAYPNPATTQSTVSYTLAERSAVTAELVNMIGQRVATIASGVQAAGPHSAGFDVANLSAGSYLLRMTVNGKTSTEPVVVVK